MDILLAAYISLHALMFISSTLLSIKLYADEEKDLARKTAILGLLGPVLGLFVYYYNLFKK